MALGASFVDWLSALATASAAVIALFVALFVPRWHEKRQEPRIDLKPDPPATRSPFDWWTAQLMRLRIHNARGKRTAEQVEVFASVASRRSEEDTFWGVLHLRDQELNFDEPGGAPPGRSTTSVPSGYSRPVSFVLIGPPPMIKERFGVEVTNAVRIGDLPPSVAVPTLYPAVTESGTWFHIGDGPLEVTLVVTGANFDAVTFRGEFTMSEDAIDDGKPSLLCEWTRPPTEVRQAATSELGPFR